jgi:GTP-binding protein
MSRRLPLVAVVGRPNVGKSTFFNRVVQRATAVVDDFPGVTRDRREADAEWTAVPFRLVDTGGLVPGTRDSMEAAILEQVGLAIGAADLILFLVDAREGMNVLDRDIAGQLRPYADHTLLVANKVEGPEQELAAGEAAELGFGPPHMISGQHGRGVGDLLDAVVARLPHRAPAGDDTETIRFTLVGRPNVGKSSLANRLLGEPRLIVHPEAGTTRDAVDVPFRFDKTDFVLIDTAGLRRRSHVARGVEYYSTVRTQKSLERSDVAVLVLDASQPLTNQDARIAGLISEAGKSLLFLFNKWDLVEKETGTSEAVVRTLRDTFPLLTGSPVQFVSAQTGLRVRNIPGIVRDLYEERRKRVGTAALNEALSAATEAVHPPVQKNGKPFKFYYATQTTDSPPTFAIFTNNPNGVPAAYRGYLKNAFQNRLGFSATPVRLVFRARR